MSIPTMNGYEGQDYAGRRITMVFESLWEVTEGLIWVSSDIFWEPCTLECGGIFRCTRKSPGGNWVKNPFVGSRVCEREKGWRCSCRPACVREKGLECCMCALALLMNLMVHTAFLRVWRFSGFLCGSVFLWVLKILWLLMSLEAYYKILWVWASSSFMKQKTVFLFMHCHLALKLSCCI